MRPEPALARLTEPLEEGAEDARPTVPVDARLAGGRVTVAERWFEGGRVTVPVRVIVGVRVIAPLRVAVGARVGARATV